MINLLIVTVLAVGVLAVTFWLPGEDLDAFNCYRCMPDGSTPTVWGFGSTCAAATTDAINQTSAMIPFSCDSCDETPSGVAPCDTRCTNTSYCYDPYGEWRVDLKLMYKCSQDLCP